MTVTSVDFMTFFLNAEYGGDSPDVIRADGVAGTGGSPFGTSVGASAGPGDDPLVGGLAADTFDAGQRHG
jgi:hypothetical protein